MTAAQGADPVDSHLQVVGLEVELDADAGLVHAVQDLRLTLLRGETFALVGESGCGKSMTALALMRLLPDNGRITGGRITAGQIGLDGQDLLDLPEREMRRLRGGRLSMIFQEPATSLNPVMTVGAQLVEAIETTPPCAAQQRGTRRCNGCSAWASPSRSGASTTTPSACPAGRSSA